MKRLPIKERIAKALADGPKDYWDVMFEVFPREQFPRAWRYRAGGGPPGCAMAFGRALRQMGIADHGRDGTPHGILKMPDHPS